MSTPHGEWQALDQRMRRAAWKDARRFRAHPDPAVSAVAARYASWRLDTRKPLGPVALGALLLLMPADFITANWMYTRAQPGPSTAETVILWAMIAVTYALLVLLLVSMARLARLTRLELSNNLTLQGNVTAASQASEQSPAAGGTPVAEQGVRVKFDRRWTLWYGARVLSILCYMAFLIAAARWRASPGMRHDVGVLYGSFTALALLMVVPYLLLLGRWVLPGRPVVELDTAGVHMPRIPLDLSWTSLAEVRLVPVRHSRLGGAKSVMVAFMPKTPSDALASAPRSRIKRKILERSQQAFGTSLTIADRRVDHSGDQIAAVAAAFASVPVRRFP